MTGPAPATTVAGAGLPSLVPSSWARHPVVVAEASHGGWDASRVWYDDAGFVVRLRWRERTDAVRADVVRSAQEPGAGRRPFAVEQDDDGAAASLLGLGDPAAVARLLVRAGDDLGRITRTSVPRGTWSALHGGGPGASGHVPAPFDQVPTGAWDWWSTTSAPALQHGEDRVVELIGGEGRREAARCLETANPDGELAVDEPRSRWWGWRDDAGVLRGVVGASRRVPGQAWVLGSIGTDPAWRGRGVAAATTAVATRAGLDEVDLVTLGVYAHNGTAGRVYRRLGMALVQEFESWRG